MPRDEMTTAPTHQAFNENAAPVPQTQTPQPTASQPANKQGGPAPQMTDFQTTTHLQVEIQEERADVLDAHDDRWNRERDHLLAKPFQAPSLGLGSDSGRSVQKEYEERLARWNDHRDGINRLFDRQIADVRAMGTTMMDRFKGAHDKTAEVTPEPITPLNLTEAGNGAENEQVSSHSRTDVRVEFQRQVRKTTRSM